MGTSKLIINPNFPVCWETQRTLRVGFETARVQLPRLSVAAQHFLECLLRGAPPGALERLARSSGVQPSTARRMISALAPVLMHVAGDDASRTRPAEPDEPMRVAISYAGPLVVGLSEALTGLGMDVMSFDEVCELEELPEATAELPDIVIYVERYLESLVRAQRWLIRGVPTLLLRFTDEAVHVGPIVVPPGAPCHACISLSLVDGDGSLPLLAAQLVGVRPRSESTLTAQIAAGYAAALVREWRSPRWSYLPQPRLPGLAPGPARAGGLGAVSAASAASAAHTASADAVGAVGADGADGLGDGVDIGGQATIDPNTAAAATVADWNPHTMRLVVPTDNGRLAEPPRYERVSLREECGCGIDALLEAA